MTQRKQTTVLVIVVVVGVASIGGEAKYGWMVNHQFTCEIMKESKQREDKKEKTPPPIHTCCYF